MNKSTCIGCGFTAALLLLALFGMAQVKNPVQWAFSSKMINATTYEIHITASIENGWHIYSQTTPEGGPIPTSINYVKSPLFTMSGNTKEVGKLEKRNEPLFGLVVKQFSKNVDFVQVIKLRGKVNTTLIGSVKFMACNDHECLPPSKQTFSIALK